MDAERGLAGSTVEFCCRNPHIKVTRPLPVINRATQDSFLLPQHYFDFESFLRGRSMECDKRCTAFRSQPATLAFPGVASSVPNLC